MRVAFRQGTWAMMDEFEGIDLPPSLRDLAKRHQRNVADLVGRLRDVGLDEATIEAAVDQLVESYRSQLVVAVKAIGLSNA